MKAKKVDTSVRYDEPTTNRVRKMLLTKNNKDTGIACGVTTSFAYATRKKYKIAFPGRGKASAKRAPAKVKAKGKKARRVKSDLL